MQMRIPKTPREKYRQNPLKDVICQVRFPTILKVASEKPSEFQERVRKEFPVYGTRPDVEINLPVEFRGVMGQLAGLLPQTGEIYDFKTSDLSTTISLAPQFVALQTRSYSRWEDFWDYIHSALEALIEIYEPAFFERIGLRYVDVIVRSELKAIPDNEPWTHLITPEVLGDLAVPELAEAITECRTASLMTLESDSEDEFLRFVRLLGTDTATKEQVFIIDSDFYRSARTETNVYSDVLHRLHSYSGNVFRWAITEKLRRALDGVPMS